jgi:hypothetical protein
MWPFRRYRAPPEPEGLKTTGEDRERRELLFRTIDEDIKYWMSNEHIADVQRRLHEQAHNGTTPPWEDE